MLLQCVCGRPLGALNDAASRPTPNPNPSTSCIYQISYCTFASPLSSLALPSIAPMPLSCSSLIFRETDDKPRPLMPFSDFPFRHYSKSHFEVSNKFLSVYNESLFWRENEIKYKLGVYWKTCRVKNIFFSKQALSSKKSLFGVKIDFRVVMRKILAILEDLGLPDGNGWKLTQCPCR